MWRRLAPLVAAVAVTAAPAVLPAAGAPASIRLAPGAAAFWSGPRAADACAGEALCWDYRLDLPHSGYRLRVAIDHATVEDVFTLSVTRPDGSDAGTVSPGDGLYSAELLDDSPAAGRYLVRVTAENPADPRFRVRAKLETVDPMPSGRVLMLPNMQPLPPYLMSFTFPITNGSAGPTTGVALPGGRIACHPEEIVEEQAVRCLRMAFGVRNTGLGPMQFFHDGAPVSVADIPLMQRVMYSNDDYVDRPAGLARYHKTHQHYHQNEAVGMRLFRVTDARRGLLQPAGAEHRKGFAHRSELLREWTRFYPTWEFFGFGLNAGWGDYYEWDRPGNYIDFASNTDGAYVLRIVADPAGVVLESNERDNVGYTYFTVTGVTVRVLETGRGQSPWDRCKIVMPIGAEPERPDYRPPARPRGCPPDTV